MATGVTVSREDNEKKLEAYRTGKTKVLVNVNILTEGVDLPQTKSVFLARPTVSTILMTQMIGRALRGEAAGGTPDAHGVPVWAAAHALHDFLHAVRATGMVLPFGEG